MEYWDNVEEEMNEYQEDQEDPTATTTLKVEGVYHQIEPGASFKDTVLSYARDAGLGKFRVFLNGEEVPKSQAPESFEEGMAVELRPFDVAG